MSQQLYAFAFVLFYLVVAHALFDFPLQGDTVAVNKNRNAKTELQKHVPWYMWMSSHALCHGGAVALITGSLLFGIAETVAHFIIDFFKCDKRYGIGVDQALHILCKITWALCIWLV
jgi:hypothetical protein